jgi:hypothetical protein
MCATFDAGCSEQLVRSGSNTESALRTALSLLFRPSRLLLPNGSGNKVGEYGYEDTINPSDSLVIQTAC